MSAKWSFLGKQALFAVVLLSPYVRLIQDDIHRPSELYGDELLAAFGLVGVALIAVRVAIARRRHSWEELDQRWMEGLTAMADRIAEGCPGGMRRTAGIALMVCGFAAGLLGLSGILCEGPG